MGEAASPGREHLLRLARECGVPEAHARQSIGAVCDAAQHLEAMLDEAGVRKATRKVIGEKVRGMWGGFLGDGSVSFRHMYLKRVAWSRRKRSYGLKRPGNWMDLLSYRSSASAKKGSAS